MSEFHLAFGIGFETGPGVTVQGRARLASYRSRSELLGGMTADEAETFKALLADFAARDLGMQVVPKHDPAQAALRLTSYPVSPHEAIRWDRPLFDSEGYEHTLVSIGSREVVTRQSFVFVIWDRKSGECRREGCDSLTIGNKPLSPQEREQRAASAKNVWQEHVAAGANAATAQISVVRALARVLASQCGLTDDVALSDAERALRKPGGMDPDAYKALAILEDQFERDLAAGEDARDGFDEEHALVVRARVAAPWRLDVDTGEVVSADEARVVRGEVPR